MKTLFFITLLLFSCKKEYNKETCQDLLFKHFKGVAVASLTNGNEFEKNCKAIKIEYTKDTCQRALNHVLLSRRPITKKRIKKKFGDKILNCFNKSELKKYLR